MNESLDSISSFFNKLLNIKSKDSAKETNRSHSLPSDPSTSGASTMSRSKQKTTSKTTISVLKAGLSDILDETSGYLTNSGRTGPSERATSSKAIKDRPLENVQNRTADNVQVAIDLTNEPDVKCLLNEDVGCLDDEVPVGRSANSVGNARNSAVAPKTAGNTAETAGNSRGHINDGTGDKLKCADRPTGDDSSNKLEIKTKLDGNGNLANERKAKIADRLAKEPAKPERMLSVADRVNESSTIRIEKTLNGLSGDHSADDRTGSEVASQTPEKTSPTAILSSENQKQLKKPGENRSTKSDKTSSELSSEPKSEPKSELNKAEQSNASNEVSTNKLNCKLNSEERSAAQSDRSNDRLPENAECLADFVPPALFGTSLKTFDEINLECAKEANESQNVSGSSASLATENLPEEAESSAGANTVCTVRAPEDHSPATDRSGLAGEQNEVGNAGSELVSTFNTLFSLARYHRTCDHRSF